MVNDDTIINLEKKITDLETDAGMTSEAIEIGRNHLAKVGIEAAFLDDVMGLAAAEITNLRVALNDVVGHLRKINENTTCSMTRELLMYCINKYQIIIEINKCK